MGKLVVEANTSYFYGSGSEWYTKHRGEVYGGKTVFGVKQKARDAFLSLSATNPACVQRVVNPPYLRLLKEIVTGNVQFGCGVTGVS